MGGALAKNVRTPKMLPQKFCAGDLAETRRANLNMGAFACVGHLGAGRGWEMESGIRAFAAFGAAVANWAAAAFGAHGPELGPVFGDFPCELPLRLRHVELVFRFPPPVEISRPERHFALQTLVGHSVYFAALFKQGARLDKAKRRVAFDAFGV